MLTSRQESDVFRALADDTRRDIVRGLASSPMPVHRIAETFDMTRPAISRHLRILKDARLVELRRAGRENVYYLRSSTLREVEEWLSDIWASRLSTLKALVEEEERGRQ